MLSVSLCQVKVMENVDIMNEEWLAGRKEWGSASDSSARVKESLTFIADADVDTELLVGIDKVYNLLCEMMHVHHDMLKTAGLQF